MAGGQGGQGLPGSVHFKSEAGEAMTTGKEMPSSRTIWPIDEISRSNSSTSDTIASSQGLPPVTATRIMVADEMGGADRAQHLRIREGVVRIVRIEAQS